MNQTGFSSGPKCFGTTKRTSFVDERDDDIPGPGAQNPKRIDRHTITQWKFGRDTERNTFLQTPSRQSPSPAHYKPNHEPTLKQGPQMSIPKTQIENPAGYRDNQICTLDYQPEPSVVKQANPKFSFGYFQERDYSTEVPASNTYEISNKHLQKGQFNKTQSFFTSADRPLPYGEQGKFPGVGNYEINKGGERLSSTSFGFSKSQKIPDPKIEGSLPVSYYDIAKDLKQPGKGWTMRPFYEQYKNKDVEAFPAPNHYNPRFLESNKKIFNYTSQRSQLYEKDHVKNPSPQKHVTSADFYKNRKSLSFTKQSREHFKPEQGPGPAKYNMQVKLNKLSGYMGKKIKQFQPFVTPAGSNYNPIENITKPRSQKAISLRTQRMDFSKSITGQVGPGVYQIQKQTRRQLGKMSKSLKFAKNYNKNPGPGFYQIPSGIGKLPKYYTGQKKLTATGYSTFALEMEEKTRRNEQRLRQKQIELQRKEQMQANKREEEMRSKQNK